MINPVVKRSLITFATVLSIGVVGFTALWQYLGNKDRLVKEFRLNFAEGDFKAIYRDSSDSMKLNVTEEEFVRRMNVVNNILQEYDPYLSFRRNVELEGSMQAIRNGVARDLGDEYKGEQGLTFAYLELGRPGKTVSVTLTWQRDLIEPKLFDLSVRDADGLVIGTLAGDPFPSVARN